MKPQVAAYIALVAVFVTLTAILPDTPLAGVTTCVALIFAVLAFREARR